MTRPLRLKLGKGRELVILNQITPIENFAKSASEESKTGSSFVGATQGSIDGPDVVKLITPRIIESSKKAFDAIVSAQPLNAPTFSTVSFRPPTSHTDIFHRAQQTIASIFLKKLKSTSYHEVAEIVASAHEAYQSIIHLKGDVTSLQEQVNSCMTTVNAYLVVKGFASELQRPESLETDIAAHQKEVDNAKALLDKGIEEYQVQVAEHSTIQS
ncbi:uncharacterized protein LOC141626885 [Silene latifolia]|uniref:uncharacterized protein LOC141626885 n=1 Tax=Silene latifolia TaxID=37657 RepID=UPI003D76CD3B